MKFNPQKSRTVLLFALLALGSASSLAMADTSASTGAGENTLSETTPGSVTCSLNQKNPKLAARDQDESSSKSANAK